MAAWKQSPKQLDSDTLIQGINWNQNMDKFIPQAPIALDLSSNITLDLGIRGDYSGSADCSTDWLYL